MIDEEFPKTALEFADWFPNDWSCREYLVKVRWPDGFRCPECRYDQAWTSERLLMICKECGHETSLTAGTVMHGTRKPLRQWFYAMWWIATQKTGGSAKGLQRLLGLGSYQTAWTWLQKLRRALVRAEREPLSGRVEVDGAYLGKVENVKKGRGTAHKVKVVVAVETTPDGRGIAGRVRLKHIPNVSQGELVPFVVENVKRGSVVATDGADAYEVLSNLGFDHIGFVIGSDRKKALKYLPNVHRIISLLKRWLLGTHHGAVRAKHLQYYLDEFAFRQNRGRARHVGKIFYRMVQGSAVKRASTYRKIVGNHETGTTGKMRKQLTIGQLTT